MALIVGLTGGIASGKSTIVKMFEDNKIPVIDTDDIARELLNSDEAIKATIIETFGEDILTPSKEINRNKLAKIIFSDKDQRQKLNDIVHPQVKDRVFKEIEHFKDLNHNIIVVDVPLLFEAGFDQFMDKTIVVYAKKKTQIERLIAREGIDEAYAKQKVNAQIPLSKKKEKADYCIDNSQSILQTAKSFQRILKKLEAKS